MTGSEEFLNRGITVRGLVRKKGINFVSEMILKLGIHQLGKTS